MALAEPEFREEFIDRVPGMPSRPGEDLEAERPAGRSIPLRTAVAALLVIIGVAGIGVGTALYDPRAGIIVTCALLLGLGLLLGFA